MASIDLEDVILEIPTEAPPFPLPSRSLESAPIWASGADGVLRIDRCGSCEYYIHPPSPRCPECGSWEVAPSAVSGRGTVYTFTIGLQEFIPGFPPHCVALVEIDEQPDVRVIGRVAGCRASEVEIGRVVQASFNRVNDEVWLPYFTLVAS